ncbi:MAG: UDP-3-O-(3-hydroxymyristoyl)glucosamine N-acyltransferase [Opitutales bacterium]
MESSISFEVEQLAELAGTERVEGKAPDRITGIATLETAGPQDLSFLWMPKYRPQLARCRAGAVLVPADLPGTPPEGQAWLRCEKPSLAMAAICRQIEASRTTRPQAGAHPSTVIAESAQVHPSACIGPHCVIGAATVLERDCVLGAGVIVGENARIGAGTRLLPRVVLYPYSEIGQRVIIHAGAVIGSDGFGYETVAGIHEKVPQIGRVVIEDDVEIGANATIDRARLGETRIGAGTKIDNLVQVGHNVTIGPGSILCAQAGVSGSTTLGKFVILAGQAGVAGHLHLADQSVVGAQGGVHRDTEPGKYYRGTPATEASEANRADVLHRKLPEFQRRLRAVEKQLEQNGG